MSALFGLLDWTGQPIDPTTLAAIQQASAAWGPDGGGTWTDGTAALGLALRESLPEDRYARLPHVDTERGIVFVGAGRLDNRDELGTALGIAPPERATMADADVMRHAYARWGNDAPSRLVGDWSFAAWHTRERRLFMARDQMGITALHYALASGRLAFASSLRALLAVPWVDRGLDEARLAVALVVQRLPRDEQSIFRGVRRLLPAHVLEATERGATTRQYWRLDAAPEVRLSSDADYAEALLDAFDVAVRRRLRGVRPNAFTLSGGLDSSSIAALAARALRPERLAAYTWAPAFVPRQMAGRFADETPFARAIAEHAGNIDVHRVDAATVEPVAALQQMLAVHVVPAVFVPNLAWIDETFRLARAHGAGALHFGLGGNATFSWTGRGSLRWEPVRRARGLVAAIRTTIVRPLVPDALIRWVRRDVDTLATRLRDSPITASFVARARVEEQLAACAPDLFAPPRDPRALRQSILAPESGNEGTNMATFGHAHGLDVRAPTLDVRLVQLCFGIPDAVYTGHGRAWRWLAREAMVGLLPNVVRRQPDRGMQSADTVHRLRAHAAAINAALTTVEQSATAREYVDVDRMRAVWRHLCQHDDFVAWSTAGRVLLRGLMFAAFIDTPIGDAPISDTPIDTDKAAPL